MKKILFGIVMGFVLTFGINVNAAEINAQLVKIFDSSTGGNVQTFNKDSILNSKLGSESGTGDNIGGTLALYNGGEENKRVVAGTSKINDYGTINLYDKKNSPRISLKADDKTFGPILFIANSNGYASTRFTSDDGYINNQKIATYDYVNANYVSKADVQKMIDDAVKKALSK